MIRFLGTFPNQKYSFLKWTAKVPTNWNMSSCAHLIVSYFSCIAVSGPLFQRVRRFWLIIYYFNLVNFKCISLGEHWFKERGNLRNNLFQLAKLFREKYFLCEFIGRNVVSGMACKYDRYVCLFGLLNCNGECFAKHNEMLQDYSKYFPCKWEGDLMVFWRLTALTVLYIFVCNVKFKRIWIINKEVWVF